jgi:hypothetical protein
MYGVRGLKAVSGLCQNRSDERVREDGEVEHKPQHIRSVDGFECKGDGFDAAVGSVCAVWLFISTFM